MAGLLDFLPSGSSGGGLLDFLRQNAMNQQPLMQAASDQALYGTPPAAPQVQNLNAPSPLDNARWPSGPIGAPSGTPSGANAPVYSPAMPQPQTAPDSGLGLGDRLLAGLQGFAAPSHGGLIGHLAAGIGGLAGQDTSANLTAKALIAKGVDPQVAKAAIGNPDLMKTLITQTYGPQTVQSLGQGYIADKNGNVRRAYEPDDTLQVVQTGEDGLGRKTYGVFNKSTGQIKPYQAPGSANADEGPGDMSKTGPAYLATLPAQQRDTVKGMLDGTIQPPTSFAMSKPYWQTMIAAAKHADPSFDENNWTARHKMSSDIASSGNSSMGGILSNGKSAFGHLAELSDSMAGLGNASHDYFGGGIVAHAQNYFTNAVTPSSATQAKIKAINDNLGHYGQESTKFYSGTGGGVEERMNALKEMNPTSTSGAEMAAYLGKERDLMLQRFREKENQIRTTMGDRYLQQHPVFTPELQKSIDKIDANIAKLQGQPTNSTLPQGWSVQVR